jgi:hypothetical protein
LSIADWAIEHFSLTSKTSLDWGTRDIVRKWTRMCYAAMSEVGKKNTNKPDWSGV